MNKYDPKKCKRCGRCCCIKVQTDDEMLFTPMFCEHFNSETRLCNIYNERFLTDTGCMTIEEGIACSAFPVDCPFVEGLADYIAPVEDWTADENFQTLLDIAGEIDTTPEELVEYYHQEFLRKNNK